MGRSHYVIMPVAPTYEKRLKSNKITYEYRDLSHGTSAVTGIMRAMQKEVSHFRDDQNTKCRSKIK